MRNPIFFKAGQSGSDQPAVLEFRALGLEHGKIDKDKGVIHGVSLITSGIEARGHDLHTDEKTLEQICELASEMGQVPVKWNHKTGADSINGYLCNFQVIGNKVKGDWHLLMTHPQFDHALELAERMPQNFGLSTAFLPCDPEAIGGKKFARCEELLSVDLVAQPAANPGGLFERADAITSMSTSRSMSGEVDIHAEPKPKIMDPKQTAAATEPTLADLLEAIKGQGETIASLQQTVQSLQSSAVADKPLSREELENLARQDDVTLARLGLTRDEVDEAVAQAMEGVDPNEGGEHGQIDRGDGPVRHEDFVPSGAARGGVIPNRGAGAGNGAGAVGAEVAAELSDLRKRVIRFERQQTLEKQEAEAEAIQEYFDSIEEKVKTLEARNEALEKAFTAGGGSVSASGEFKMPAGVGHGDGAGHGDVTEFETVVADKAAELMAANEKLSPRVARAQAVRFCQANNRDVYAKHLEARGVQMTL